MASTTQPSPAITTVLRWPSAYNTKKPGDAVANSPANFTTYFNTPIEAPPCTLTAAGTLTLSGDITVKEGSNTLDITYAPWWNNSHIFNMRATYNYFPELFPNQLASYEPVTNDGLGDPYGYLTRSNDGCNCFTILPNPIALDSIANPGTKLSFPVMGNNLTDTIPTTNGAPQYNNTSILFGNWSNNLPSSEFLNWHNVYLTNIAVTIPFKHSSSNDRFTVSVDSTTITHWANTQGTILASQFPPSSFYNAVGSQVVLPFVMPFNAGYIDGYAKNRRTPGSYPIWTPVSTSALVHGIRSAPSAINRRIQVGFAGNVPRYWFTAPEFIDPAVEWFATPVTAWYNGAPMFLAQQQWSNSQTPIYNSNLTRLFFYPSFVPGIDNNLDRYCILGGAMACGQWSTTGGNVGQMLTDTYRGYGYRFSTPYGRQIATFHPMFAWIDENAQSTPDLRYSDPIFSGNYTKLYTVTATITIPPGTYSQAALAEQISTLLTAASSVKMNGPEDFSQTKQIAPCVGVFDPVFDESGAVVFSSGSWIDADANVFANNYQLVHISQGPQRPIRYGAPQFGLVVSPSTNQYAFTQGAASWATPEAQPGSALIGNTAMVCYTVDLQQRMPWDPAARTGNGSQYPYLVGLWNDGYVTHAWNWTSFWDVGNSPVPYLWMKNNAACGYTAAWTVGSTANPPYNWFDTEIYDYRGINIPIDQAGVTTWSLQTTASYALNPHWFNWSPLTDSTIAFPWYDNGSPILNNFPNNAVIQFNSQPQLYRLNPLKSAQAHGPFGILLMGLGNGTAEQNMLLIAMGFDPLAVSKIYDPSISYVTLVQPPQGDPTRLEDNMTDYYNVINSVPMHVSATGTQVNPPISLQQYAESGALGQEVAAFTATRPLSDLLGQFIPTVHPTNWNLTPFSRAINCGFPTPAAGNPVEATGFNLWPTPNGIPASGYNAFCKYPTSGEPNTASPAFEAAFSDMGIFGMPGMGFLTTDPNTVGAAQRKAIIAARYKCAKKPVNSVGVLQLRLNERAFCAYQWTINEQATPSAVWNSFSAVSNYLVGASVTANGNQFEWVVLDESNTDQTEPLIVPNPPSGGVTGSTVAANYTLNSIRLRLTFNGGTQIQSAFYDEGKKQPDWWPVLSTVQGTNTQTIQISCNIVWYTPGMRIDRIQCELMMGATTNVTNIAQTVLTLTLNPTGELPPVDQAFFAAEGLGMRSNVDGMAMAYTPLAPTPQVPNGKANEGGSQPTQTVQRMQATMGNFHLNASNSLTPFLNTAQALRGRTTGSSNYQPAYDELAMKRAKMAKK